MSAPAGDRITFTFAGRTITAAAGQSVGAALYAAGVRTFSRSFKYHRPRGLFCVAGDCPNCLMEVDGRPNVRTCIEPARGGMVVCAQHAWPSLDFDIFRLFDRLDRFLPVGFYYKRFYKPRWLWPIFEHTVRHLAGLGRVDIGAAPALDAEVEHLHAEVCIVGAGPAGLAAATEAAAAGADVLLLERHTAPGGRLLYTGPVGVPALAGWRQARREGARQPAEAGTPTPAHDTAVAHPRVRLRCGATVFGLYEGNLLGAFQEGRFLTIRARQVIICTGARQRPFIFHKNDLPGIFLGDGALRLARLQGVQPGRRAVVLTECDSGRELAAELAGLGIEIAGLVDSRADAAADSAPWPTFRGQGIVEAVGGKRLKAVRLAPSGQTIACDLLCLASKPVPANELLLQGGVRFGFDSGAWVPSREVPGIAGAGGAAGVFGVEAQSQHGRLRGAEAAAALGYSVPQLDELVVAHLSGREAPMPASAGYYKPPPDGRKRFICLCEDVTEKDLEQAVAEGFDNIETLKRYATVGMGPCQGKVCGLTATETCARLTGRDLNATGTTTCRPPVVPVELGILAAEWRHQPVRRTPLHSWHEDADAVWIDAGQWKRPEHYGDPVAEVRTVRTSVGLIDVSTLGKLELLGPDAAELLERVYLNRWADLRPGRVRYGAMCNEEGILFDDGVGGRLADEHFYLTATTGNADAVFQWLELWRATWRLNVAILNETSAVAAMNLAGPEARAVLQGVTELDVSATGFPYLTLREGRVAGVACRLLRIGFVGELGYEIHCPAACARHLWDALCEAGRPLGLRPFGVEAQRVLRLEKGHAILGQDTDALSTPLDAGMGAMVRFDKPLFHGREPLLRLRAMPPRARLVGFHMAEGLRVPREGCQVVEEGRPVGRVTSARYSPTLARSIGLAWVPSGRAAPGSRFFVRSDGLDLSAVVTRLPFYDPEGRRLRV